VGDGVAVAVGSGLQATEVVTTNKVAVGSMVAVVAQAVTAARISSVARIVLSGPSEVKETLSQLCEPGEGRVNLRQVQIQT
jgi:hypothetical protein